MLSYLYLNEPIADQRTFYDSYRLISRRVIASLDHVGNEIAKKERRHKRKLVCKVFLCRIRKMAFMTRHTMTLFFIIMSSVMAAFFNPVKVFSRSTYESHD